MRSSNGPLKLFIGNLGDNRKSDLSRVFSKYGEISMIYVDENKHFAFVEFTSSADAQRALEHVDNKTVNGSKLRVEYAKSEKSSRDHRRPLSRDRSPTANLYSHLQVTANRLPSMQMFRQNYQHPPLSMGSNHSIASRGRSLTPPSFKQNYRLSSMYHLRSHEPYYHPPMYSDPAYYGAHGDPYLMQRLPPPGFLSSSSSPSSSSRAYRDIYPYSGSNRYSPNISSVARHRRSRSRSRHRISQSHRDRSDREHRQRQRTSSPEKRRGPQTPPPMSSIRESRKRSRSSSKTTSSTSDRKSSSNSSPESIDDEEKQTNSRRSVDDSSERKHSKRKTKE